MTFPSAIRCAAEDGFEPMELVASHWPRYTGVDLSSAKRPGNAFVTIAQRPTDRKRVVVDVRAKGLTSPQTWRELEDIDRRYGPDLFLVENNGLQDAVLEWGHELNTTLPVQGFLTHTNKADPVMGLPGLEVEFENEGWIIPRPAHSLDCDCAWCRLWTELLGHPLAETTDLVMALWFAREAARGAGRMVEQGTMPVYEDYRG